MRWERLFDDLEAQLDAADRAELAAEVADRSRREAALLRTGDRLAAAVGTALGLHVLGGGAVQGVLEEVGRDWLLLAEPAGGRAVVPLAALAGVTGLGRRSAPPAPTGAAGAGGAGGAEGTGTGALSGPGLRGRLGLGHVLRGVARDRAPVVLELVDGTRLTGTLDLVGADFVELAEHPPGEPRRRGGVRGVRLVPLPALAVLRAG
ncbi:hypothetical protein [Vallicoccus soli]|uniref:Uncharacterized protein n=1 Tax=Vallicoccus soli TaxID=2339232 RepID=A0A3A3ZIR2_9ACTN|nr:hypothetical protein [Vallicoccus soli]RJK95416.1 hypothetical protein D5H78_12225 [Vallicoccus soli]